MEANGQCHTICSGENELATNCTVGWMAYTASLDTLRKRKILAPARNSTIFLRRLAWSLVTILTTLQQLLKFILFYNEHFFINIMYKYRNITFCIFTHHTFLLDTHKTLLSALPHQKNWSVTSESAYSLPTAFLQTNVLK